MLKAPQEDRITLERSKSPKKPLFHRMSSWVCDGLQRVKEQIVCDWEYICENHSTALAIAPFVLNGTGIAYASVIALGVGHVAEQEYRINCYYTPSEEQGASERLCKMASWFGAPTHEDYEEKLSKEIARQNADHVSTLQKDCKDAVGRWITEPQDLGVGSRIECEDSNGDGVPDAVHYEGLGEDTSYSIHTGEKLPRR